MKIRVKSNYNDFIKHISKLPEIIDIEMQDLLRQSLEDMVNDMKSDIQSMRSTWLERGSALDELDSHEGLGNDIEYELEGNKATIYVGRNTSKLTMKDGRQINPYFFIEFGYGIEGQNNPVQYAAQNGWAYNINGHKKSWSYEAWYSVSDDPIYIHSTGRQGIDFFYKAVRKYRQNWEKLAEEAAERINRRFGGF